MYRPALVIGLGGTGVLTLQHLKAHLCTSREGEMPPQVRLIALDTVKDKSQSAQTEGETSIAALRTELDPGEYHWIGGNVYDFVRSVDQGEHPHIGSWFQARAYLESLPAASFSLERGSGQLRQFGRLAIFKDVAAPGTSAIFSLVNRAINEIRRTGYFDSIDVFLVASVAGGTGAGMFADIAHLVRQIAKDQHALGVRLRGFLVLSEAFSKIPGRVRPDMRARAYACMRENTRFMVDFQYEHGYPMYYHEKGVGGVWRSAIKIKLFDFLYHVDGQSKLNPLTDTLPEYGVTAGIADAIAAMLDKPPKGEEDVYDRHTQNVIAQASLAQGSTPGAGEAKAESTSFDSAVGCYSLILPMQQITDALSHKLALEALEILLQPAGRDRDNYIVSLAPDANAQTPGRGRSDVARLLDGGEVQSYRTGEKVEGTEFFPEVARVAKEYNPQDPVAVRQLSSRQAKDWEGFLAPSGTSPEILRVRGRVRQELDSNLTEEVPANLRGESARGAVDRILRDTEDYKGLHLGREDVRTGQRVGGQYQRALEEYTKIQLNRFWLLLQTECENILNGGENPGDPASVHHGGKLGYLLDFLAGMEETLGRFLQALREDGEMRKQRGEKKGAVTAAHTARQALEDKPGGIMGGRRRNAYLEAQERLIATEKTLIIEDLVRQLAQDMFQRTQQLQESAESWAAMLGLGLDSVHGRLQRGQQIIQAAISAERSVPVREFVWDQQYMDELYQDYAKTQRSGVDDYLGKLFWRCEHHRSGVREMYGFQVFTKHAGDEAGTRLGLENQELNVKLLLAPAQEVFAAAWEQETILKYLMRKRYPAPKALADLLASKADVWLLGEGPTMVPANYLHVTHGTDPAEKDYLDTVQAQLMDQTKTKSELNGRVNSADRFTLRLVHTMDLIPLEGVDSYKRAAEAYWSHAGEVEDGRGIRGRLGRETIHLFPAEVEAARLESRIPARLSIHNRALHNEIVVLLEDMELFRLLVRSRALGLIHMGAQDVSGPRENFWCLDLPEEDTGSVRGPEPSLTIYLTRPAAGRPDLVKAMKNWCYQQGDVRPGINVSIPYPRTRQALLAARDQFVRKMQRKGEGIGDAAIQKRAEMLGSTDQKRFLSLWLERSLLQQWQQELKEQTIDNEEVGRLDQDAAIAEFMVLDDEIESLNLQMDTLLQHVR